MPRREQLEQMLQEDPNDAFLLYALAMTYVTDGNNAVAIEKMQHVIDRDPQYVAAYFQKGQVLAQDGQAEKAKEVISMGIDAAQQTGDAHAEAEMKGFLESL